MALVDDLEAQLALLNTRIAALLANPTPNVSLDGKSVSWQSYLDSLLKHQADLIDLINAQRIPESSVVGY